MATIPPRKPRLGEAVKKGVAETKRVVGVTHFVGEMEAKDERTRVEKMGLDLEEEIGVEMEVLLRILNPMAMLPCIVFTGHPHLLHYHSLIYSSFFTYIAAFIIPIGFFFFTHVNSVDKNAPPKITYEGVYFKGILICVFWMIKKYYVCLVKNKIKFC